MGIISFSKQQQPLSMAIYYVCPTWRGESIWNSLSASAEPVDSFQCSAHLISENAYEIIHMQFLVAEIWLRWINTTWHKWYRLKPGMRPIKKFNIAQRKGAFHVDTYVKIHLEGTRPIMTMAYICYYISNWQNNMKEWPQYEEYTSQTGIMDIDDDKGKGVTSLWMIQENDLRHQWTQDQVMKALHKMCPHKIAIPSCIDVIFILS